MFDSIVALDERGREVTLLAEGDPINGTSSFVEINSCLLALTSSPSNIQAPPVPSCFVFIHFKFSLTAIISVSIAFNCCVHLIFIYFAISTTSAG